MHGMNKQRKTNMKIHHKNMKQVSHDMQQWVQSNLAHLGIFECNYSSINAQESTWMGIPMSHRWYCHFMEQGLDKSVVARLQKGSHYLEGSDILYKKYAQYIGSKPTDDLHRYDYVIKNHQGFETLTVSSNQLISKSTHDHLNKVLHHLSYQAQRIVKNKSNIESEFRFSQELTELFEAKTSEEKSSTYMKSKFHDVILTAKEQLYIEYLIRNLSHKEIAHEHDVSETGVRHVLRNIKRKLGNDSMSTPRMFELLDKKGVLSLCSQALNNHALEL